jgi:hypothetical protein
MDIPFSEDEISSAILETVKVNGVKECYIRPIAFVGYGAMGLYAKDNPINVAVAVWPWGAYLGEEGLEKGIRIKTSSFVRTHVNTNMTRAKVTGYYVNSQLAKREALMCGYDEALLLDADGYVSEGSGENIFVVRNGVLKTTPPTSILEGITRESILTIAAEHTPQGREVHPRRGLHLRRGLFHRHCRGDNSHQGTRRENHRRRRSRPGNQEAPDDILRYRKGKEPQVRGLADLRLEIRVQVSFFSIRPSRKWKILDIKSPCK